MGLSLSLIIFIERFLVSLMMFCFILAATSSGVQPDLCHDDERFALFQFKESFTINRSASEDPSAYSKVSSWKPGSSDCCKWDGVECNNDTGHVIGLHLSSSFIYGSLDSNSSIFHLSHLQNLNLADNDFNSSPIPTTFRQLSRLTELNLSMSVFSGQIPSEIFELSKLVFLDLSYNRHSLKLQKSGLTILAQNLSNLKVLRLSHVDISSNVPNILANLSFLTTLSLRGCDLHGEFPVRIFHLPNLLKLSIPYNEYLTGRIPEFHKTSPLKVLRLEHTNFYGELPDSIGNLKSLEVLYLDHVDISSNVPNILANLSFLMSLSLSGCDLHGVFPVRIFHLPNLQILDISYNEYLTGRIPEFHKTSPLKVLRLEHTNFYGELPDSIGNLKSMIDFSVYNCNFSGEIPSSLGNLTNLIVLQLQENKLHGSIPQSISRLGNLETLFLYSNILSGTVEFDLFLRLKYLVELDLSGNNISVLLTKPSTNSTFPKFGVLYLIDCDLREFPEFLRSQDQLEILDLSSNKIHGQVPKWMGNVSIETLSVLSLKSNFLTGFNQLPVVLPYVNLKILELDSNLLQGSLPIPPPSIFVYKISDNKLTGEIPSLICNLSSVTHLDLSSNNLSGLLPKCLGNLRDSLLLDLHRNNFHGTIPQIFGEAKELRMINFSQNRLHGRVPRSLSNCTKLEALDLGENRIHDIFPCWLGILPELRVLILRSNELYGKIGNCDSNFDFRKLHIIDLSNNDISGKLSSEQIENWKALQIVNASSLEYIEAYQSFVMSAGDRMQDTISYSMIMINKGKETEYEKVLDFLAVINLSSNKLEGEIPEVLGHLKGLNLLNLSHNFLTGPIPLTLANLRVLEALDLSENKLFGMIPPQLSELTFLSHFNVSHNRLNGPIPHGNQFDTFNSSSFADNPELCGKPLSKRCGGNLEDSLPSPSSNHGFGFSLEFGWEVVAIGYGCGFVFGVVFEQIVITKKYEWFMKTFAIGKILYINP